MAVALKHGDVVDRYLEVLPGAGTLADSFLDLVEGSISAQNLPVNLSRESATAGLFGGTRGVKRPVLLAEPTASSLADFSLYIFSVPSGVNLTVGWYLTEAGRGNKNLAKSLGGVASVIGAAAAVQDSIRNLSIFDMADLQGIMVSIHQFSVMETIFAVATRVKFDHSRIASQSRGFFNIG
ncbi:MAG: hypothetical protein M0Z91_08400 [Actinomycetota bacterium]|nr:hypothetical protein [Actinomycetota bacterium]